jgi:hypothetical protein
VSLTEATSPSSFSVVYSLYFFDFCLDIMYSTSLWIIIKSLTSSTGYLPASRTSAGFHLKEG